MEWGLALRGKSTSQLLSMGTLRFTSRMAQEFDYLDLGFAVCSNGVEQGFKPCVKSL
jgi:hypothetical protein